MYQKLASFMLALTGSLPLSSCGKPTSDAGTTDSQDFMTVLVQSENGPHFHITFTPEVVLRVPCNFEQGYVFAAHFRQEFIQKALSPSASGKPSNQAENPTDTAPTGALRQFIWPVQGGTITSGFGPRFNVMHEGLDIAVPSGTSVVSAAAGQILFAGWSSLGEPNSSPDQCIILSLSPFTNQ